MIGASGNANTSRGLAQLFDAMSPVKGGSQCEPGGVVNDSEENRDNVHVSGSLLDSSADPRVHTVADDILVRGLQKGVPDADEQAADGSDPANPAPAGGDLRAPQAEPGRVEAMALEVLAADVRLGQDLVAMARLEHETAAADCNRLDGVHSALLAKKGTHRAIHAQLHGKSIHREAAKVYKVRHLDPAMAAYVEACEARKAGKTAKQAAAAELREMDGYRRHAADCLAAAKGKGVKRDADGGTKLGGGRVGQGASAELLARHQAWVLYVTPLDRLRIPPSAESWATFKKALAQGCVPGVGGVVPGVALVAGAPFSLVGSGNPMIGHHHQQQQQQQQQLHQQQQQQREQEHTSFWRLPDDIDAVCVAAGADDPRQRSLLAKVLDEEVGATNMEELVFAYRVDNEYMVKRIIGVDRFLVMFRHKLLKALKTYSETHA